MPLPFFDDLLAKSVSHGRGKATRGTDRTPRKMRKTKRKVNRMN